jgi:tol-pal system protein YbgF
MVRVLSFFVLVFALAAPAEAQSRRELAARLDAAEARLAEIEDRALQGDPVAETLMARLDALEREQRVLTGEIERLGFENRRLRGELEAMGRDVDALLSGDNMGQDGSPAVLDPDADMGVETDPNDPFAADRAASVQPLQVPDETDAQAQQPQPPAQDTPPMRNPGRVDAVITESEIGGAAGAAAVEPEALFSEGRARLLDGDFGGAREAFAAYTEQFPEGAQAGEAWYWLGETHFINNEYDIAADSYIASLQQDRQGVRAPDALVRLGASFAALGQGDRACQVLATFPAEFPNATEEASRKAQREVSRLGCR